MNNKPMSLWGIGPLFVIPSIILSVTSIVINHFVFPTFKMTGVLKFILIALGILCIILGIYLWLSSAFKIHRYIKQNELFQDGVYGIVRHPIYSGIWFVLSGLLLLFHSYILILIPIVTYIYLSLLIKKEEKILIEHFGKAYLKYKKKVNAIIPTFFCRIIKKP